MESTLRIRLSGAHVKETARALGARLVELGYDLEEEGTDIVLQLATPLDAPSALDYEVDPNDPGEFAAEKILDDLEARDLIALETPDVSAEEEEAIRQRLQDLGYIE